jgi:hypothetical protein
MAPVAIPPAGSAEELEEPPTDAPGLLEPRKVATAVDDHETGTGNQLGALRAAPPGDRALAPVDEHGRAAEAGKALDEAARDHPDAYANGRAPSLDEALDIVTSDGAT